MLKAYSSKNINKVSKSDHILNLWFAFMGLLRAAEISGRILEGMLITHLSLVLQYTDISSQEKSCPNDLFSLKYLNCMLTPDL